MANELNFPYDTTGLTDLYAVVINENGQALIVTAVPPTVEAPTNANTDNYDIPLTESDASRIYRGSLPTDTPEGIYEFTVYQQVGVSPSLTNDTYVGISAAKIYWSGTDELPVIPVGPTNPATISTPPLKATLLDLPYYARIMGINPVHFAGATADDIFPIENRCSDVWPRFSWQNSDAISHDDLARAIYNAEQDIARELGWWPAPKWIAQEVRQFPRHYRPDVYRIGGRDVRGQRVGIKAKYGKVIAPGQRATTLVGTATTLAATLVYSDDDSDGFAETARITLPTALTDVGEIKAYFPDQNGVPEWEIRRPRSKTISGGSVTFVYDSWLLIHPDVQGAFPTTAGFSAIDISTTANFVSSVDVYREYNDTTANSAEFYWEPTPRNIIVGSIGSCCTACGGTGCIACSFTTQDGCLHIRDAELGFVVPTPGTYDSDNVQWTQEVYSCSRDPDFVKIYYYCGNYDEHWLSGLSNEPLSNYWAQTIAWLATARLERPFCSCANVTALSQQLREDLP